MGIFQSCQNPRLGYCFGYSWDALMPFFLCNFDYFHLYLKRSKFVCARTLTNTIVQPEDMHNECIVRSSYIIVFSKTQLIPLCHLDQICKH